jgi:hypothetical protein
VASSAYARGIGGVRAGDSWVYGSVIGALLLELHLQASLDCEEHQKKEEDLIRAWPGRLKSDGYERVRIFTLGGVWITVRARDSRRACDRRSGKRYKGA